MASEKFNVLNGISVGIPSVDVVDGTGNVVSNFNNLSGNVSANRVYANNYFYANGKPFTGILTVSNNLTISDQIVQADVPIRPGVYTVGTLPTPEGNLGAQLFVIDGTRPNRPVYSDGVNWLYVSDDSIVI